MPVPASGERGAVKDARHASDGPLGVPSPWQLGLATSAGAERLAADDGISVWRSRWKTRESFGSDDPIDEREDDAEGDGNHPCFLNIGGVCSPMGGIIMSASGRRRTSSWGWPGWRIGILRDIDVCTARSGSSMPI
jgi:hypothetical protein